MFTTMFLLVIITLFRIGSGLTKVETIKRKNHTALMPKMLRCGVKWNQSFSEVKMGKGPNKIKRLWEKSLCTRDKAENRYWTPMISGPSGSTALKIVMVPSWKSLHVLRNTVNYASHRRRLKLYDTRNKTYVNICFLELPRSSLGQSASKMDWIEVEKCSVVR